MRRKIKGTEDKGSEEEGGICSVGEVYTVQGNT